MRSHLVLFVAAACVFPAAASAEPLSLDDVIALSGAGLGDAAIIAKVQSAGAHFDLSPQRMIDLRKRGVSSAVIASLIGDARSVSSTEISMDSPNPAIPHPSGLYALVGRGTGAKMVRIDPTTTSQMKTSGILGYALTYGLAGMGMKVTVSNATARVRTASQPTFYFYFDESRPGATTSSFMGSSLGASSPNEFTLVRLERKSDHRETKVGKINIGGAKVGVMDKDRIGFRYDNIRPGVFMVTPSAPLDTGEYGFLYSLPGAGMGGAMTARIFDFGVEPPETASSLEATPVTQTTARIATAPATTSTRPSTPPAAAPSGNQMPRGIRCVTCR